MRISIQSFVDVITNSSTTIYTLYDSAGCDQIRKSVEDIIHVINPNANVSDYVNIECVYSKDFLDWVEDNNKLKNLYETEDLKEILLRYSDELRELVSEYENELDYYEPCIPYDLEITPLNKDGEQICNAIYGILNAFKQDVFSD